MWLGLYLIAFSFLIFFASFQLTIKKMGYENHWTDIICGLISFVGLMMIPLITIAYGVSLIVNN